MTLRMRFVLLMLLALISPMLISQAILMVQLFNVQETEHRHQMRKTVDDAYDDLSIFRHSAQFSSKLIASSGALYRYINHDRLRMPEKSTYLALLKNFSSHLVNKREYHSIFYLDSNGKIITRFDLRGAISDDKALADNDLFLKLAADKRSEFYWYSTSQEPSKLLLMTAQAVHTDESSEISRKMERPIIGYIVISVDLQFLPFMRRQHGFDDTQNQTVILRHSNNTILQNVEKNNVFLEELRKSPATESSEALIGDDPYILEFNRHEPGLSIEAWQPRSAFTAQVTPLLLKNLIGSLAQITVISLIFYFILSRWLIVPLENAQELTGVIKSGRWLRRPENGKARASHDEVSRLLDALYDMSDALEKTTQALDQKRLQAEQAERLKTEFLSNLSHEIRTPVNIIVTAITRLEKHISDPRHQDALAMARKEALKLVKQFDELMLLADLETKKQTINASEFFLPDLLQHCIAGSWPTAQKKGLQLALQAAQDTQCILLGDSQKLSKVIEILVENAVKFTHQGTVTLHAQVTSEGLNKSQLMVQVEDSGPGIAEDEIPLLGQAFRQLDGSIARQHEGLGMGLAICRGLLGLMNSSLEIISTPGKGSIFSFRVELLRNTPVNSV